MAFDFRHATLENGLTVIAETSPDAHTAAVGFFVKTGARDEPRELMGVSHFLEHMAFKGSERRNADAVNRDFDRIGPTWAWNPCPSAAALARSRGWARQAISA